MANLWRAPALTVLATAWALAQAQVSSSTQWWSYLADYDGMPGSTRVDMGQKNTAPLSTLPYVVIVGVEYETNLASGLPSQEELDHLNGIADRLIEPVLATTPSIYVGTFTHKRQQEHYIYVQSLTGTEEVFRTAIAQACPSCRPLYRTKIDPKWDTYLKFLYPNTVTMEYYGYDPKRVRRYRE